MDDVPLLLLISDDRDWVVILTFVVLRLGFQILTARHGQGRPGASLPEADLIVIDDDHPSRTGPGLLRSFRHGTSAPLLLQTARGEPDYLARCFSAGADNILVKPFALRDLQDVLGRLGATKVRLRRSPPGPADSP